MEVNHDLHFMREAIREAKKAFDADEVPVGAVIVAKNRIIARAFNLTQLLTDVTAHAEMQAITAAAHYLGSKYLIGCTLYVSLEPCVMCAGALFWSQIDRVVFGAYDKKRGFQSWKNLELHPKNEVLGGVLETESTALMQAFFKEKRL